MTEKQTYLTREGVAKLKEELEYLRTVRRHEIAERIQQAKELGTTVNNAEYDDAKNEQAFVEGRVLTLEKLLKNAAIIEDTEGAPTGTVGLGSTVTVVDSEGHEESYTIVGSAEASPSEGRISNESPVGKAVLGKAVGDVVQVSAPRGALTLTIVRIE